MQGCLIEYPVVSKFADIPGWIQNLTSFFANKSIKLTVLDYALEFEVCPLQFFVDQTCSHFPHFQSIYSAFYYRQ